MNSAETQVQQELHAWQQKMQAAPGPLDSLTRTVQTRLNALLPEKLHQAITATIRQMVQAVLFGSKYLTRRPLPEGTLAEREQIIRTRIRRYRHVAVVEGAATGAAGFFVGLTDFPLLLGIKLKLLFDVAALYGYDVQDYTERLYLLHVFQLAFSSQHTRNATYQRLARWDEYRRRLPPDAADFDWRTFQQEYRDYIDLAKLAQLIPFIGAAVGAVANYRLLEQLGETAMNCYRMRYFSGEGEAGDA